MNQFTPPYLEQVPLTTLDRTLRTYEEMLDILENMPGKHTRRVRSDLIQAMEVVQIELVRRRLGHLAPEPMAA